MLHLGQVTSHCSNYVNCYAEDIVIYLSTCPAKLSSVHSPENSLADFKSLMSSNSTMLNADKTKEIKPDWQATHIQFNMYCKQQAIRF